jgi:hypothetical protein
MCSIQIGVFYSLLKGLLQMNQVKVIPSVGSNMEEQIRQHMHSRLRYSTIASPSLSSHNQALFSRNGS